MTSVAWRMSWVATTDTEEERTQAARAAAATIYTARLPAENEDDWRGEQETKYGSELIGVAARARYSVLAALDTRPDAPLLNVDGSGRRLGGSTERKTTAPSRARPHLRPMASARYTG
jgi:hypothetical protein